MEFKFKLLDNRDVVRNMSKIKFTEEEKRYTRATGKRFLELRMKYGLTQEDLANQMNIAPRTLSMIENGKASPNSIIIYRVTKALGISLAEFYDDKTEQKKN